MTGKLCRTIVAIALAGAMALGPVAPARAQAQGQTPAGAQPQGQAPATAPSGMPAQTPAPAAANQVQPATPVTVAAGPDYTVPRPWFPHPFAPYRQIHMDAPQFTNSPDVQHLIQNGKLQLSVQQAVELALQNNPDIAVQRYWSWIAESDILRAKGGGTQRGEGVVTTPLGFGDVPLLSYDPVLSSSGIYDHRTTPINNPLTSGTGTSGGTASVSNVASPLTVSTETANLGYAQSFREGTSFSLAFNNVRTSSTSPAVLYNPSIQSTGTVTFTQPLLNGFGFLPNERYIRVAIITKRAVDFAFKQSLITDITAVEDDYWELVFARGNVDVQQRAVQLAQTLYDDNKRQVDVGTLAPLEIVRAEAQLATAQQALITAQSAQLQQQSLLMSVITKDPNAPELRNVEIVPSDTVQTPPVVENVPLADAVAQAVQARPDVLQARTNIQADDVNLKVSKNALLPSLTASAFATSIGLGGNSKITASTTGQGAAIVGAGGTQVLVTNQNGIAVPVYVPSTTSTTVGFNTAGFGTAESELFQGQFPEFQAQLSLSLPIRNRVAQADNARALLAERQDQARLQQTLNGVAVDVQTAQINLQEDRPALVAAQKTRALQEETLDADQKKLELGVSTIFVVVTDQQALSAAAAAEVRAEVNLVEAKVNYDRALGATLDVNQITLANAQAGSVPKDTLIPGTAANGKIIGAEQALQMLPNSAK